MRLTDTNKNIIAAAILAFGLIVSAIIYAYSNRYYISEKGEGRMIRVDKWEGTGKYITKGD